MRVLLCLLCFVTVVGGTTWPRDVASDDGGNVTVTCRPTSSNTGGMWQFKAYGTEAITTVYKSSTAYVAPGYEVSSTHPHDLIIDPIGVDQAGGYNCMLDDELDSVYGVVMLVKDLTCSIGTEGGDAPGSPVTFDCRVSVYGRDDPNLNWLRQGMVVADEAEQTVVTEPQQPYQWRTISLEYDTTKESEHDNEVHTCRVFWPTNAGNTQPEFETECTETYRVRHPPSNMEIRHEDAIITPGVPFTPMVGDNITCSVSAYPSATLTWEHVEGPGPAEPQVEFPADNHITMYVSADMVGDQSTYNCLATAEGQNLEESVSFVAVHSDESIGGAPSLAFVPLTMMLALLAALL